MDEFETAFAEAIAARRRRGGRPRKAHRDELVVLAVERALAIGLPLTVEKSRVARHTAFAEAARILRRDFGRRMSVDAVRVAYYRRKHIEQIKARFESLGAESDPLL